MILETKRLLLRPFYESDAEDVYAYARDPRVGPVAGWPAHKSVEDSRQAIRTVFAGPRVFAIVTAIGCATRPYTRAICALMYNNVWNIVLCNEKVVNLLPVIRCHGPLCVLSVH